MDLTMFLNDGTSLDVLAAPPHFLFLLPSPIDKKCTLFAPLKSAPQTPSREGVSDIVPDSKKLSVQWGRRTSTR